MKGIPMNLLHRALLLAPVILVGQDAAKPVSYADRYRTEAQAIQKLIADVEVVEALQKLEAIIGDGKLDAFDKSTPGGSYASHQRYYWAGRAYFDAARSAQTAGQWEKAVDLYKKALDVAQQNATASKEAFTKHIDDYKYDILTKKAYLEGNADAIAELRAKANPTADDKQKLATVKDTEDGIVTNEKWIGNFNQSIQRADGEVTLFKPFIEDMEKAIQTEAQNLETYKFKNDKVKFVEGYAASKPAMDQLKAQGKSQALAFLYRLSYLDPENKKVRREIDLLLGRTVAPEPAAKPGKKKGA